MTTKGTCYYRNGTQALDDTPCPNTNTCCPSGATCTSNLLCRDKNNHANGSLTDFPDGHSYNYTGLYYTPSCQDESYRGCLVACTTYDSYRGQYVWACNAALTSYCCHDNKLGLSQGDCCGSGTFELVAPGESTSATASVSASASASSTLAGAVATSTSSSATSSATATATAATSLSPGAKAGIGIGAAAAGIIIIVLIALLLRARRGAAKARGQNEKNTFRTEVQRTELEAFAPPSELPAKPARGPSRFELGS